MKINDLKAILKADRITWILYTISLYGNLVLTVFH